jgi:hypothetical protein
VPQILYHSSSMSSRSGRIPGSEKLQLAAPVGSSAAGSTASAKQIGVPASTELALSFAIVDDYLENNAISISPRDTLSFVDDKKQWKETTRFLAGNSNLNMLTRMIQTEVIRCKPDNILDFINDEFFSLENQTRLRNIIRD